MQDFVNCQCARLTEALAAYITLKRLFLGVNVSERRGILSQRFCVSFVVSCVISSLRRDQSKATVIGRDSSHYKSACENWRKLLPYTNTTTFNIIVKDAHFQNSV